MRFAAFAFLAATIAGATAVQAQTLEVGPGGVGVDLRGPRERVIERDEYPRDGYRERRRRERFRDREELRAGGRGCREITVRSRNEYGERVTRTRRECR